MRKNLVKNKVKLISASAGFPSPAENYVEEKLNLNSYLIKNKELSNNDIYSIDGEGLYFYSGGWHLKGVYSLFLGFIFSSSTIWNVNLMFLQTYSWIIGAFVAWITYYLLAKK